MPSLPRPSSRVLLAVVAAPLSAALAVGLATAPEPASADASASSVGTPSEATAAALADRRAPERASRSTARTLLTAQAAAAPTPVPLGPEPTLEPVLQKQDSDIPFRTLRREDPARFRGTETVVQAGRVGVLRREYLVVSAGGVQVSRTQLREEQVRAPRTRVVAVGTKARPQARAGLNWDALARCESGGDPRAVSSSGKYRGLYQFDLSTWRSVGGSGDPVDADRAEQTHRASKLYDQRGRSPWPHCGRYL